MTGFIGTIRATEVGKGSIFVPGIAWVTRGDSRATHSTDKQRYPFAVVLEVPPRARVPSFGGQQGST